MLHCPRGAVRQYFGQAGMTRRTASQNDNTELRIVSLKSISELVDAHRSTVRRWLTEAGIHPVSVGRGRTGAIRYRWPDIERWLSSLEQVD